MKQTRRNQNVVAKRKRFFNRTKQNVQNKDAQKIANANTKHYVQPKVSSNSSGIMVKKREFISNIEPISPFTPQKVECNPGINSMFPWLSGVAVNFEKYRIHKISFIYETAQSTFIPGMIMLAPEFNISDALPESKSELLEYAFATRAPVWKNFRMDLPSSAVMNYKDYYIRANDLSVENDKKLYDPFYLIYASDAVQEDISYAGELWVEYEIELLYPQRISLSVLRYNGFKSFTFSAPTNGAPFTNVSAENGGLLLAKQDSATLLFSESFTGQVQYLIDVSNIGLSTKISTNPAVCSVVSNGTITSLWGVGGAGTNNTDPDYIVYIFSLKNIEKGDLFQVSNLGFDTSGGTTAVVTYFMFQSGYVN